MKRLALTAVLNLAVLFSFTQVMFTTPDTVCVNSPVTITNKSSAATSYFWNFCVADINTPPAAMNIGNPGNQLSGPVFMDYAYSNGNYYGFVVSYSQAQLVRLNYGNSLLNIPTAVNLGTYGGLLQNSGSEGIQVVQNEGKWYALIVGGTPLSGTQPRIVKIDFGTDITSAGTATNWGNIGNMNQPIDFHVFKEGNNWYGFTVNAEGNTITRFNFTNNFENMPSAVNLGNLGGLIYPTGIYAINDNGFWRVFITNAGDNQRIGTLSSITRLDFGSSLLNTPTAVNLGNPGGMLHHPRDFTIMKFCGQIIGFAVNGNPAYNDIVRLNFNNDLTRAPTINSLGTLGSLDFPHSISRLFRVNDDVYAFITNVASRTITRLRFQGCTNASISSSTQKDPHPVTYSTPGTYNINLTIDDGLPTQSSYCKQVVVLPEPVHTPTQAINICDGDNVKIGSGIKYAQYTWNTGNKNDSISVNTAGTYWVQSDRYGCSTKDSMVITTSAKPVVNLGPDATLCMVNNLVLDAGNAGAHFLWQDGSTNKSFNVTSFGKYFVQVTSNGCKSSDTMEVEQSYKMPADFIYKQDVCNPLAVQYVGSGNYLQNIYWSFGDGKTATGTLNTGNNYPDFGDYIVKFAGEYGICKDTVTKVVSLKVTPANIILTPDTTICFNATKQLRTQQALQFCWFPTSYLNDPNVQDAITSTTEVMTYYFTAEITGSNLVANGDFANGNIGFTSKYNYTTTNINEGELFVGNASQEWNPLLAACGDHTSGSGNMLLVNGATQANTAVWTQNISITPNTNYAFSTWLQNINNTGDNPPRLQFAINGNPIGPVLQGSLTSCTWDLFHTTWNSGNHTSATISILNQNMIPAGNNFALDDISFAPVFIQRDSVKLSIDTPVVLANRDTTICKNGQAQLLATGALSWSWTPANDLSNSALSNPIAHPAITTEYIVTGKTIHGCTAKDTVVVNLFPVPEVITDHDVIICPNATVQLSANTALRSYSWSPTSTLNNPAIANPLASPYANTVYTVQGQDVNNCNYSDTVHVEIRTIRLTATTLDADICRGDSVLLTATGGHTYHWTPTASLNDASLAMPVARPDTTTMYSVYIKENNCGHDTTIQMRVTVNPDPIVNAEKTNDINCLVHSARLRASGSAGNAYLWKPTRGLDHPSLPDPVSTTDSTITYVVTGSNMYGCSSADSVTVYVTATEKVSFEVPNAFTPNGDGHNDCLGVKSWGGVTIEEFAVFNRWGERVFLTNNQRGCWDGRYKGQFAIAGGYMYVIKAKTWCGSIKRTGTVVLIR